MEGWLALWSVAPLSEGPRHFGELAISDLLVDLELQICQRRALGVDGFLHLARYRLLGDPSAEVRALFDRKTARRRPERNQRLVRAAYARGFATSLLLRLRSPDEVADTFSVEGGSLQVMLEDVDPIFPGETVTVVVELPDHTYLQFPARLVGRRSQMMILEATLVPKGISAALSSFL